MNEITINYHNFIECDTTQDLQSSLNDLVTRTKQ